MKKSAKQSQRTSVRHPPQRQNPTPGTISNLEPGSIMLMLLALGMLGLLLWVFIGAFLQTY